MGRRPYDTDRIDLASEVSLRIGSSRCGPPRNACLFVQHSRLADPSAQGCTPGDRCQSKAATRRVVSATRFLRVRSSGRAGPVARSSHLRGFRPGRHPARAGVSRRRFRKRLVRWLKPCGHLVISGLDVSAGPASPYRELIDVAEGCDGCCGRTSAPTSRRKGSYLGG